MTITAASPATAWPTHPSLSTPAPPDLAFHGVLGRLSLAVGANVDPSVLVVAATAQEGTWHARLLYALASLGIRATERQASLRELAALVTPGSAWVTCLQSDAAAPRWLLVSATPRGQLVWTIDTSSGGTARAQGSPRALAAALAFSSATASHLWVSADPALPLEVLRDGQASKSGAPSPSPLRRVRALASVEGEGIWIIATYSVLVGLLTLATPLTVQVLVNTVAFGTLIQPLVVLVLMLFGVLALAGMLRVLESYVAELLQRRLFVRAATDLAQRLPRLHASVGKHAYPPELVNRFFDVVNVQKSAATLLLEGLELALQAAIGMAVLAFYHPLLLAFDALLVAALAIVVWGLGRRAIPTSIVESDAKYAVAAWLEDIARAPSAFCSRRGALHAAARADALAVDYLERRSAHFRVVYRQIIGVVSTQVVANALLLGLGGWLVLRGELTLGQLVAAEIIVNAVVSSISKFGKHFEAFYDLAAGVAKLGKLVDLPLEHERGGWLDPSDAPLGLRLVSATTVDGETTGALRDVTLEIPAGAKVALTGPASAGKSALLDVIFGRRDLASGVALLDGVDASTLSAATVRDAVGFVRGPETITGTIDDNVRLGQQTLPPSRIDAALAAVGLTEEIARLPEGRATRLTPAGAPLSTSQAIRLTLARALASQPRLLLVDGALDRIEPAQRGRILDALCAADAPWTLVVVSHAPDVLARCERLVRLRQGAVEAVEVRS